MGRVLPLTLVLDDSQAQERLSAIRMQMEALTSRPVTPAAVDGVRAQLETIGGVADRGRDALVVVGSASTAAAASVERLGAAVDTHMGRAVTVLDTTAQNLSVIGTDGAAAATTAAQSLDRMAASAEKTGQSLLDGASAAKLFGLAAVTWAGGAVANNVLTHVERLAGVTTGYTDSVAAAGTASAAAAEQQRGLAAAAADTVETHVKLRLAVAGLDAVGASWAAGLVQGAARFNLYASVAVGAIGGTVAVLRDAAAATDALADSQKKLTAGLSFTNNGTGLTAAAIEGTVRLREAGSDTTRDDLRAGAAEVIRYRTVTAENLDRVVAAYDALAEKTGKSVPEAAKTLGKWMDGGSRSVEALAEAGIHLSYAQEKQIKSFEDLGDRVGAATVILDAVSAAANAAATSSGDSARRMDRAWADFSEGMGTKFAGLIAGWRAVRGWWDEPFDISMPDWVKNLGSAFLENTADHMGARPAAAQLDRDTKLLEDARARLVRAQQVYQQQGGAMALDTLTQAEDAVAKLETKVEDGRKALAELAHTPEQAEADARKLQETIDRNARSFDKLRAAIDKGLDGAVSPGLDGQLGAFHAKVAAINSELSETIGKLNAIRNPDGSNNAAVDQAIEDARRSARLRTGMAGDASGMNFAQLRQGLDAGLQGAGVSDDLAGKVAAINAELEGTRKKLEALRGLDGADDIAISVAIEDAERLAAAKVHAAERASTADVTAAQAGVDAARRLAAAQAEGGDMALAVARAQNRYAEAVARGVEPQKAAAMALADYQRAMVEAQARVDAWNRAQGEQIAAAARVAAAEGESAAAVAEANTVNRIRSQVAREGVAADSERARVIEAGTRALEEQSAVARVNGQIRKQNSDLDQARAEYGLLGQTNAERERAMGILRATLAVQSDPAWQAVPEATRDAWVSQAGAVAEYQSRVADAKSAAADFTQSLTRGLEDAAVSGGKTGNVLKELLASLKRGVFRELIGKNLNEIMTGTLTQVLAPPPASATAVGTVKDTDGGGWWSAFRQLTGSAAGPVAALGAPADSAMWVRLSAGGAAMSPDGMAVRLAAGGSGQPLPVAVADGGGIIDAIRGQARAQGVPEELAVAIGRVESGLRQYRADGSLLTSSAGAVGVMQLMPATAAKMGINPADVQQNIEGGVAFLASLGRQFGGDWTLAAAAYNAGPGRIRAWQGGNATLPAETADYLQKLAPVLTSLRDGADAQAGAQGRAASAAERVAQAFGGTAAGAASFGAAARTVSGTVAVLPRAIDRLKENAISVSETGGGAAERAVQGVEKSGRAIEAAVKSLTADGPAAGPAGTAAPRTLRQRADDWGARNLGMGGADGWTDVPLTQAVSGIAQTFGAGYSLGGLVKPGNKVGGALVGAGGGALTGAMWGSVVPGVGTAVGAVAGAVIGAVGGAVGAGSKPSNKEGTAIFNFASGSITTQGGPGDKYSQENVTAASNFVTTMKGLYDLISYASQGKSLSGDLVMGTGDRDGSYAQYKGVRKEVDKGKEDQLVEWLVKEMAADLGGAMDSTVALAVRNLNGATSSQIQQYVQFAGSFEKTVSAMKAAFDGLSESFQAGAESADAFGKKITDFLKTARSTFPVAGGLPGYAVGTDNAAPGLAWVGESGPELVQFGGGERVYTAAESPKVWAQMLAGLGRKGDTELVHLNPGELRQVQGLFGRAGVVNPYTGLLAFEAEGGGHGSSDSSNSVSSSGGGDGGDDPGSYGDGHGMNGGWGISIGNGGVTGENGTTVSFSGEGMTDPAAWGMPAAPSDDFEAVINQTLHDFYAQFDDTLASAITDHVADVLGISRSEAEQLSAMTSIAGTGMSIAGALAYGAAYVGGSFISAITGEPLSVSTDYSHTDANNGGDARGIAYVSDDDLAALAERQEKLKMEASAKAALEAEMTMREVMKAGNIDRDYVNSVNNTVKSISDGSFDTSGKDFNQIASDINTVIDAFVKAGKSVPHALSNAAKQMEALSAAKVQLDSVIAGPREAATDIEKKVSEQQGYWNKNNSDFVKALESVGYKGDLLDKKINEGLSNNIASIRKDYSDSREQARNEASGKSYLNQLKAIEDAAVVDRKNRAALGMDQSEGQADYLRSLTSFLAGLDSSVRKQLSAERGGDVAAVVTALRDGPSTNDIRNAQARASISGTKADSRSAEDMQRQRQQSDEMNAATDETVKALTAVSQALENQAVAAAREKEDRRKDEDLTTRFNAALVAVGERSAAWADAQKAVLARTRELEDAESAVVRQRTAEIQALEAQGAALEKARAQRSEEATLVARGYALTGRSYRAEMTRIANDQNAELLKAAQGGAVNLSLLSQIQGAERQQAAISGLKEVIAGQIAAVEKQTLTANKVVTAMESLSDSMAKSSDALALDESASPLSPQERADEARRQWRVLVDTAYGRAGADGKTPSDDQRLDAIGRLTDLGRTYITANDKDLWAGTTNSAYAEVQGVLKDFANNGLSLFGITKENVDAAKEQINQLEELNSRLDLALAVQKQVPVSIGDLNTAVTSAIQGLADAQSTLAATMAAKSFANDNGGVAAALFGGDPGNAAWGAPEGLTYTDGYGRSMSAGKFYQLAFASGYSGSYGNGEIGRALADSPDFKRVLDANIDAYFALLNASNITLGHSSGAYAVGTDNAPPGWATVGENGPELVRLMGGEQVLTAQETRAFAEAYRGLRLMPANDPFTAANVVPFQPAAVPAGTGSGGDGGLSALAGALSAMAAAVEALRREQRQQGDAAERQRGLIGGDTVRKLDAMAERLEAIAMKRAFM